MTNFYPDEMDEHGNYHYGHFEEYITGPKRKAFFIYNDDMMLGFVMLNPYSVIGHEVDYTMAEFTIFPSYRRNHYAIETAELILSTYKGRWEIKYNEKIVSRNGCTIYNEKNWSSGIESNLTSFCYVIHSLETLIHIGERGGITE